jgi:hypothetical protein
LSSNLLAKESFLNSKEIELKNYEMKYIHIQKQENDLNIKLLEFKKAMNHFYNYEVAGITKRHGEEVRRLEEIITQQIEIGKNLQIEINKLREVIEERERERVEEKKNENDRKQLIEKLENEIKEMEEDREALKEQLAEAMVRYDALPCLFLPFLSSPVLPSPASLLPPLPLLSLCSPASPLFFTLPTPFLSLFSASLSPSIPLTSHSVFPCLLLLSSLCSLEQSLSSSSGREECELTCSKSSGRE